MSPISVTASNLILGPARLYIGAFGANEPLDSAVTPNGVTTPPSSGSWTDVGGTDGGVTYAVEGTLTDLSVDQIIMAVGSRLTDLKMTVTTKMSEMTLANMNSALNSITSTGSGSGYSTQDITVTSAATQPTYSALIIDGWAPYLSSGNPALRRIIVRKVLATPKVSMMYDKKTQASYDVSWGCYFVSNSVNPVHVVDQTA
jgi:hypothetical protein